MFENLKDTIFYYCCLGRNKKNKDSIQYLNFTTTPKIFKDNHNNYYPIVQ